MPHRTDRPRRDLARDAAPSRFVRGRPPARGRALAVVGVASMLGIGAVVAQDAASEEAPCVVKVTLTDESGRPAPSGVAVMFEAPGVATLVQSVDTEGVTVFADVPCVPAHVNAGDARVLPNPGFSRWASSPTLPVPGVVTEVHITVPATVPVDVRVEDSRGRPASYGAVTAIRVGAARGESRISLGTPPLDGTLRAMLHPGTYLLEWRSMEHAPSSLGHPVPNRTAHLAQADLEVADTPVTVRLVVAGRERVDGRVVDEHGDPLGYVDVYAQSPGDGRLVGEARTEPAEGRFSLPFDDYPVRITPIDDARDVRFEPATIELVEPPDEPIVIRGHDRDGATIHGRVVDAETGEPIDRAVVRAFPDCETLEVDARFPDMATRPATTDTDEVGRFELRCNEKCGLKVAVARQPWIGTSEDLPVGSCGDDLLFELTLGNSITGTVRNERGRLVRRVPVALYFRHPDLAPPEDDTEPAMDEDRRIHNEAQWLESTRYRTWTRDRGTFEFEGLGPGLYRVAVVTDSPESAAGAGGIDDGREVAPPFVAVRAKATGTDRFPVDVEFEDAGGESETVDLRLEPAGGVCGEIRYEDESKPVLDRIEAYGVGEAEPAIVAKVGWVPRKGANRRCVGGLPAGDWEIRFGHPRNPHSAFASVWYPGEADRAFSVPVRVEGGKFSETGDVVVEPVGTLAVEFPEWDPESDGRPRIELWLPVEDAEDPEQRAWSEVAPANVGRAGGTSWWVFAAPVGTYAVRACRGVRSCDREDEVFAGEEVDVEVATITSAGLVSTGVGTEDDASRETAGAGPPPDSSDSSD